MKPKRAKETSKIEHHIVTSGPPVYVPPRRLFGSKLKIAKEYIRDMIKRKICRPSSSPWASPLQLVKKKTARGDLVAIIAD